MKKNSITTKDGTHLHYDSLLIASGGRPRVPKVKKKKKEKKKVNNLIKNDDFLVEILC
jgi:NAD(P)H-nitrite reductase large subunit